MVSLSYRSLANYILEDNLIGLRGFLENRHVVIDDRDEVCKNILKKTTYYYVIFMID